MQSATVKISTENFLNIESQIGETSVTELIIIIIIIIIIIADDYFYS